MARASRRRIQDPIIPPYITVRTHRAMEYIDLPNYMLRNRIIIVSKRITDIVATQARARGLC